MTLQELRILSEVLHEPYKLKNKLHGGIRTNVPLFTLNGVN